MREELDMGQMSNYEYITENNLENRQKYMYSHYRGLDFLQSYLHSRREFLRQNEGVSDLQSTFERMGKDKEVSNTSKRLLGLYKHLSAGKWTQWEKSELDGFLKAFEVRKRLYNDYVLGTFRPVDDTEYKDVLNYLLLAAALVYGDTSQGNLKYFNCLLKINDTLLSLRNDLTIEEKKILATIITDELCIYERLA